MGRFLAAMYDIAMVPNEVAGLRRLRRRVVEQAKGRVLEIGLGTGANLGYYQGLPPIVGVESDADMLRRAQARGSRAGRAAHLVLSDGHWLPFRDGCFDTALATLVLCTVAEPLLALDEIKRVLRPGGSLILLEHVRASNGLVTGFQDAITPVWKRMAGGCHLNRDTLSTVRAANFQELTVVGHLGGLVQEIRGVKGRG